MQSCKESPAHQRVSTDQGEGKAKGRLSTVATYEHATKGLPHLRVIALFAVVVKPIDA
jgi:hypothetical protein